MECECTNEGARVQMIKTPYFSVYYQLLSVIARIQAFIHYMPVRLSYSHVRTFKHFLLADLTAVCRM